MTNIITEPPAAGTAVDNPTPAKMNPFVAVGKILAAVGRWTTALAVVWPTQYLLVLPLYALWRLIARSGWIILAVLTLGISVLVRSHGKQRGREHQALVGAIDQDAPTATMNRSHWRNMTSPWLSGWVTAR